MTSPTPNCFGLPSIYHQRSEHCAKCPHHDRCEEVAYARLLALSERIEVGDALARYQDRSGAELRRPKFKVRLALTAIPERRARRERVSLELTAADHALIAGLPTKVAEKVQVLMKRGNDRVARAALAHGRNPFPADGAKYLHVACERLLAGGFTRAELRVEFMRRLAWKESTAFSHVSSVVSMFPALGFAHEQDGRFVLHPRLRADNQCN